MRTISFSLSLALVLATPSALALAATSEPADVTGALDRAFADPEIQRDWPDDTALSRSTTAHTPVSEYDRGDATVAAAGHVANTVLWAIAIAVVVLLLAWLALAIARYRGEGSARAALAQAPATASAAPPPAPDPDAPATLAAQGRYSEALHAMLLRALWTLPQVRSTARAGSPRRAILSTLDAAPPPGLALDALSELVEAVELTHFGGRPATAADYERHLPAYHLALGRGAAA